MIYIKKQIYLHFYQIYVFLYVLYEIKKNNYLSVASVTYLLM
jgi:hypothetical protein